MENTEETKEIELNDEAETAEPTEEQLEKADDLEEESADVL